MGLRLITEPRRNRIAQARLKRNLKASLRSVGILNLGFQGGNMNSRVYVAGERKLFAAFETLPETATTPRFWNAFGIYEPDRPAQDISVEINIPTGLPSGRVSGFFAEDVSTGSIFLMHNGRLGGGRAGIGQSAFLASSKLKIIEAVGADRGRAGIPVADIDDPQLVARVWKFVTKVQSFKDQVAAGYVDSLEFKKKLAEFDRYSKEFAGEKYVDSNEGYEYITYHGDVVQELYDHRTMKAASDEDVFNSVFVDLFVKKSGVLTEIYEVKTGTGRQVLYTAIGQLLTHSAENNAAAKYLVIPAGERLPPDFERAIDALKITIKRFKLINSGGTRSVQLLS